MNILYEDKNILICQKEPGVVSQHSPDGAGLADSVKKYCGYAGIVHRLDQNVGGAIIFGKNKNAAAKLSALISENKIEKRYLAVVHGCPAEKNGVFKDLLFKDSSKNKSFVVKRMRRGVKEASLEYENLATAKMSGAEASLVAIKLHTGRTHQIRVQFSSRKMPLVGDGKYGSKDNKANPALWSNFLVFTSPFNGKKICAESLPDFDSYPWNLFDGLGININYFPYK